MVRLVLVVHIVLLYRPLGQYLTLGLGRSVPHLVVLKFADRGGVQWLHLLIILDNLADGHPVLTQIRPGVFLLFEHFDSFDSYRSDNLRLGFIRFRLRLGQVTELVFSHISLIFCIIDLLSISLLATFFHVRFNF